MKKIKNKFSAAGFLCIFILQGLCLYPQETGNSIIKLRNSSMETYRKEIAAASLNEIKAEDIGVWYEVLESSLFMLIRRTELYRGRMRLIIEDSRNAKCKIFPDGTILISTAIFDYIDSKLAESQNVSPRRIKNFNSERENLLASFIAFEAADFALDNKILYLNNPKKNIEPDLLKRYNLQADRFAVIFLKLAGYNANLFYTHLEELKKIQNDTVNSKNFESFFTEYFSPQQRIASLLKTSDESEVVADEISSIIEAIQNENENTIEDAKQSILNLSKNYPNNLYIKRLAALVLHKKWSVNAEEKSEIKLITAYPSAMQNSKTVNNNFHILNKESGSLVINQKPLQNETAVIPGDINEYDEAVRAYKIYLNSVYESGIASSYSALLFYSPNLKDKATALSLAEQAALNENGTESMTAALNYAGILYLLGKDYTKAKTILENILTSAAKKDLLFLRTGKIIDERIILYNYSIMLFGLSETLKAEKVREKLKILIFPLEEYSALPVKKIKLGDSTDDLTEYWGTPSSIKNNYFSEKWKYDFLNAEVTIDTKQSGTVEKIVILKDSVLSLPNDLRTGESKRNFEAVFGKPLYYAGDTETYFYKANKIQVMYLNDYIRFIYLSK
ncbi:hypothetical protein [Treponema pedis]|uniref:Uncharacterized protein n=1 Tax=Treponema pedis str. T A4 TaxID=1291379 RepID=S5ZP78_9SPIR|nr:hypothetical protein [Treponema pedis]AGT44422.1 hypothetical protein TPE_1948 [Treponema pedis str. T A4]